MGIGVVLLLALAGGVPPGGSAPGLHRNLAVTVDGQVRTYDLYVPPGLGTEPVPLVLCLHGHGGNADQMTGWSGRRAPFRVFMDLADRDGFLVVYPEGLLSQDGKRGWNDGRRDNRINPTVDDVAFLDALITRIEQVFPVDPDRIHACGVSNGGFMSLRLATDLGDRVASVAAVVAALPAVPEGEKPGPPVSVLFMNGTDDPLVPWGGGPVLEPGSGRGTVLGTMASARAWTRFLGTAPVPAVLDLPDINQRDGSTVRRWTWSQGRQGSRVVLYEVDGGGHTEPSIQERYFFLWELLVGRQNHDLEMAEAVWAFFQGQG